MKKPGRKPAEKNPRWVAFGRRVADLRKAKGYLQMDVARAIGIDPVTMSRIETGDRPTGPERETIDRLARFYEIPVDELMGERQTAAAPHHAPPAPRPDRPTRDARDVFPSADRAVEPADTGLRPAELAAIRAAVSDAIFAAISDIFESVATARARATAQLGGEAGRAIPDAPGERTRRRATR